MEQAEDEDVPPPKPEKRARSKLVLSLVVVVLVLGAATAGALAGPKLLQATGHQKGGKEAEPKEKPADEKPVFKTVPLDPIVVDTRAKDGTIHHVKVSLSLELAESTTPEELQNYMPRGREAAIVYLRGHSFEDISDPERFETIRKELSSKVATALGQGRTERVVVTDFVTE